MTHILTARHAASIDIDALIGQLGRSWRTGFPNFMPAELASKDDGSLRIDLYALMRLQAARIEWDAPFEITSAYRTPAHNKAVGGSTRSRHMAGDAFDIRIRAYESTDLEACLRRHGARGIGRYRTFIHADWRPGRAATWGTYT